jgi:hypothetical protein
MTRLVGNALLDPIASEVNERLGRVLQNVADMGTGVSRG